MNLRDGFEEIDEHGLDDLVQKEITLFDDTGRSYIGVVFKNHLGLNRSDAIYEFITTFGESDPSLHSYVIDESLFRRDDKLFLPPNIRLTDFRIYSDDDFLGHEARRSALENCYVEK